MLQRPLRFRGILVMHVVLRMTQVFCFSKWTNGNILGIALGMRCCAWRRFAITIFNATHTYAFTSCATIRTHGNKTAKLRSQRLQRGWRKSRNACHMYHRHGSKFLMFSTEQWKDNWPFRGTQSSLCNHIPESSHEATGCELNHAVDI